MKSIRQRFLWLSLLIRKGSLAGLLWLAFAAKAQVSLDDYYFYASPMGESNCAIRFAAVLTNKHLFPPGSITASGEKFTVLSFVDNNVVGKYEIVSAVESRQGELINYPISESWTTENATKPVDFRIEVLTAKNKIVNKISLLISTETCPQYLSKAVLIVPQITGDNPVPMYAGNGWYFRSGDFYNTGKDSVLHFVNDVFVSSALGDTSASMLSYLSLYPEGQPIGGYGKRKALSLNKKVVLKQDFDLSNLSSGNYYLVQRLMGSGGKILAKESKMFQILNKREGLESTQSKSTDNVTIAASFISHYSLKEIKRFLAATEVISTESAYQINRGVLQSKDSLAIKARLLEYWKLADENNPEAAFTRFAKRLNYADQRYSVKGMPVWKTERARVLLIYGEPNVIENEYNDRSRRSNMSGGASIPYEIWTYNKIDRTGAQGIFVFVQDGGMPNNYKLLHSSVPGEISNNNWRNLLNAGRSR